MTPCPPTPFLGVTCLISGNESRARASAPGEVPRQAKDRTIKILQELGFIYHVDDVGGMSPF
jgi:hypothetical protein